MVNKPFEQYDVKLPSLQDGERTSLRAEDEQVSDREAQNP